MLQHQFNEKLAVAVTVAVTVTVTVTGIYRNKYQNIATVLRYADIANEQLPRYLCS